VTRLIIQTAPHFSPENALLLLQKVGLQQQALEEKGVLGAEVSVPSLLEFLPLRKQEPTTESPIFIPVASASS